MPQADHESILAVIASKAREALDLPSGKTALLVIDMQEYFVQPDGRFAMLGDAIAPASAQFYRQQIAAEVLPNVERLVSAFRTAGAPLYFTGTGTRTGNEEDLAGWLRTFNEISRGAIGVPAYPRVNEPDWQIHKAIAPNAGESVLQKTTADPFVSTKLEQLLRDGGIRTVVVCGVTTDVCVSATARGAADRDFEAIVVEDACATVSEQMHRAALEIIGLSFGRVVKTDDVLATLQPIEPVTSEVVPR